MLDSIPGAPLFWIVKTTTAIDYNVMQYLISSLLLSVLATGLGIQVKAEGIRDHTRPDSVPGTRIKASQAVELTLTRVRAEQHNLQTWIRLAAVFEASGRYLLAKRCSADARLIQVGQRVRFFSADSKSSIYRARITQLDVQHNCVTLKALPAGRIAQPGRYYVMEIIVQRGQFFSIPKEAIIEQGAGRQLVYLQRHPDDYIPQQVHTGLKGELYTEIVHGLNEADQVVTFGSFFIDAEYKLKFSGQAGAGHAHHHH